jgi:hypothetical protein
LVQGLFTKIITIHDQPLKGGGWLDLKYECTKKLKRKAIIQNESMIHFNFPKSTTNHQKPYSNDVWTEKKLKHKFDKNFFSILDSKFNDKFYTKKWDWTPPMKHHLQVSKLHWKGDRKHCSKRNCSIVHSFGHPLYVW